MNCCMVNLVQCIKKSQKGGTNEEHCNDSGYTWPKGRDPIKITPGHTCTVSLWFIFLLQSALCS